MTNDRLPLVSVIMITYNHERFLAQAIESVLMQQTDFEVELLIGEDCSTDRTRQVIERYVGSQNGRVRLLPFFRSQNMGIKPNFVDLLGRCQGKYVALLEGDDYWIDPYKLQKQADFLDAHPDYVIVGANALSIREDENYSVAHLLYDKVESFDFDTAYLMETNPYPTLTVCFRNHLINEFPEIYYTGLGGDRRLYLLLSQHGKCRYENNVLGVYRVHFGGASQKNRDGIDGRVAACKEQIANVENWNRYFGGLYGDQVKRVCDKNAFTIVRLSLFSGNIRATLKYVHLVDLSSKKYPLHWELIVRFFRLFTFM
jgi:glycosyltransferase involved in cell wall biosynthesis